MSHSKDEIIKKRIAKLNEEDFDLEAWKETTHAVLQKLLDADDHRLKQIDQLKVDYGSWALRDATASYNPVETAKKKGKDILESILDEGESFNIAELLSGLLSNASMKKIKKGVTSEGLVKVLKKEKKDDLASALAQLIAKNL